MNRAPKKADSSLKSKIGFNNNQNSNNNNNTNNVGQNNTNSEKEGEQENEHIIECMNVLNEQEEAEQFAISLLEEIIWNAETLLFEKYIEKQIIPFTLNFFENKIMEIIDWNFFKYDNGIINEDAWSPDKELVPIINDSWARGAIPVKQIPKKNLISVENSSISLTKSQSSITSIESKKHSASKNEKVLINKNKTKKVKENNDNNIQTNKNTTPPKKEKNIKINDNKTKKIKHKSNPTQNTVKSDKLLNTKETQKSYTYKNLKNKIGISDIINNKQSTIQIQNMNKDGWNIDNIYNYTGQLISTIKTSPDKTFEQSVKAQIVEPVNTKQKQKDKKLFTKNIPEKKIFDEETIKLSSIHNNNLNNDIEKLQNDINVLNNFIRQKNALSSEAKKTLQKKNIHSSSQKLSASSKMKKNGKLDKLDPLLNYNKNDLSYNYEKYVEDVSLEIPSFINSINIAPGVKICEGNTFKSGPSLYSNKDDKNSDPKILLLKKGKQDSSNSKKDPRISNELLKDIILKTNPSLRTSE